MSTSKLIGKVQVVENQKISTIQNELDPDRPMFPISVIAETIGVHQRTLRIYDKEGLLTPSRSLKNRRLYSYNDLERARLIHYLTTSLGVNLSGIKIITYLLEELKIPESEHLKQVNNIALNLNISPEIQEENKAKNQRRGRKPTL